MLDTNKHAVRLKSLAKINSTVVFSKCTCNITTWDEINRKKWNKFFNTQRHSINLTGPISAHAPPFFWLFSTDLQRTLHYHLIPSPIFSIVLSNHCVWHSRTMSPLLMIGIQCPLLERPCFLILKQSVWRNFASSCSASALSPSLLVGQLWKWTCTVSKAGGQEPTRRRSSSLWLTVFRNRALGSVFWCCFL